MEKIASIATMRLKSISIDNAKHNVSSHEDVARVDFNKKQNFLLQKLQQFKSQKTSPKKAKQTVTQSDTMTL